MAGKSGYGAVPKMRRRARHARGGQGKRPDELDRSPGSLAERLDAYAEWMAVHQRTPAAIESRRKEVLAFLRWAEARGITAPEAVTRSILESYQRWLHRYRKPNGQPLGNSTQRGRLGGLKQFFAWQCKQRLLEANPASEIELPRPEKRLTIEALSVREVETVIGLPDIADPLGLRDRAILELFYSTGIRRTELVNLAVPDLHRDRSVLHVRQGKGRKDRFVPVGARALRWALRYLDEVRPLLLLDPAEQALFLTGYGGPFHPQVLGRLVKRYLDAAEIGRTGSCHLLRHTCATHMLEGGADIRTIQQLLGHENLETTALYTEVSIVRLQAVHAQCHPAESRTCRKPGGEIK